MADGAGPKIGDARSLWNFTPSPGWTKDECLALRQCLKKFGVGKWVQIVDSGVLPGKQIQQLNGQTQRLLGKQSLAEYSGLRLDIDAIRNDNDALEGCVRKNGLITNQGGIRSKVDLMKIREENLKKYGLSPEEVDAIELPAPLRAAPPLGAGKYMGKNQQPRGALVGIDTVSSLKANMMTLSVDELSREQKIALLKALHSRVDELRTQLRQSRTKTSTPRKSTPVKVSTPRKGTPTKSATPVKAATPRKSTPVKAATPSKAAAPSKAATPRKSTPVKATARKAAPVKRAKASPASAKKAKKAKVDVPDGGPVSMLMAMGFSQRHSQDALEACDGDMEESVEWLMQNCS